MNECPAPYPQPSSFLGSLTVSLKIFILICQLVYNSVGVVRIKLAEIQDNLNSVCRSSFYSSYNFSFFLSCILIGASAPSFRFQVFKALYPQICTVLAIGGVLRLLASTVLDFTGFHFSLASKASSA